MVTEILVILAVLFLIALVLAPIIYYTQRSKYQSPDDNQENGQ